MTEDEIKALAREAAESRMEFAMRSAMNTPTDVVEYAAARFQYEKSRVRMERADKALYDAIRGLAQEHGA
jgi:hypothetical protein